MGAVKIIKKIGSRKLWEIEEHFKDAPLTVFEHGYLNGMILDGYMPDAEFGIKIVKSFRKSCAKPGKDTGTEGGAVTSSQARMGQKSAKGRVAKPVASLPKKKPLCQTKGKESSACSPLPGTSSRKPRSGSSSSTSKSTARAKPATARKSATTTRKAPSRKATSSGNET